jgi:hypothetical protein
MSELQSGREHRIDTETMLGNSISASRTGHYLFGKKLYPGRNGGKKVAKDVEA